MKKIFRLLALTSVALVIVACNKAEFKTATYVTFQAKRAMIPEATGIYAIPVNVYNGPLCDVTYKVTEGTAKAGVDYVVVDKAGNEDKSGVLRITEGSDSIYFKITDRTGELTKNLSFKVELLASATESVYLGASTSIACTIVDADAGINLLGGSWAGTGKDSKGGNVSLSFDISILDAEKPESAEILEYYPNCNLVFESLNLNNGDMDSQGDIYGFFDDNTSKVHIYANQYFNAYNFEGLGPQYVGFGPGTVGGKDDIVFTFDDDSLVLDEEMVLWLYDYETEVCAGYYYKDFVSGFEMKKID